MKVLAAVVLGLSCSVVFAQTERPKLIDVELKIIALGIQDVESMAREGDVDEKALLGLWKEGRGRLIAAPRVVAREGVEASLSGAVEYIYPTQFQLKPVRTNETTVLAGAIEPSEFETREVGVILSVLAELAPQGDLVHLTVSPETTELQQWHDFGAVQKFSSGESARLPVEVPFFRSNRAQTALVLKPGETVLLGGGLPSEDGKDFLYTFVTVQVK